MINCKDYPRDTLLLFESKHKVPLVCIPRRSVVFAELGELKVQKANQWKQSIFTTKTGYICNYCPRKPGLHPDKCFEAYHSRLDYSKTESSIIGCIFLHVTRNRHISIWTEMIFNRSSSILSYVDVSRCRLAVCSILSGKISNFKKHGIFY